MIQGRIMKQTFHFLIDDILDILFDLQIITLYNRVVNFSDWGYFLISILLFFKRIMIVYNF